MKAKKQKIKPKEKLTARMWKNRELYLLILPALAYVLIFDYGPMYGLQIAFKDYKVFTILSDEEEAFVKDVQTRCANKSITLVRDKADHFPLSTEKTKHLGIIVLAEHLPAKTDALALKEEFEQRGFAVDYYDGDNMDAETRKVFYERNDIILYAMFSRPFRPIGFLDYTKDCAWQLASAFILDKAIDKTIFVSFGSPYFGDQYLERAQTYVNAYAMLDCSCRGFVRAACGEVPFEGKSPVKLWE